MEKKGIVGSTLKAVIDRIFVDRRVWAHTGQWRTFELPVFRRFFVRCGNCLSVTFNNLGKPVAQT
jgi:hypothetical protein